MISSIAYNRAKEGIAMMIKSKAGVIVQTISKVVL